MVLKSKTPNGAANELKKYLVKKGYFREQDVSVEGPKVMAEGGPFEWPIALCGGGDPAAWGMGHYSKPGDFPDGLMNDHVYAESNNHWSLTFYKR